MIRAVIFDCFGVLYADPGKIFYENEISNYDELRSSISDIDKQFDYGFITAQEHAEAVTELSGLDSDFILKNVRGAHVLNKKLLDFSQTLRPQFLLGMLSNIGYRWNATVLLNSRTAEIVR